MKNLTKSLLATLMLMGFSLTANASCGFDGNNKGGLSFSECVRQEYLRTGKKAFERDLKNGDVHKYFGNYSIEEGIAKIKQDINDDISVGVYKKHELKKLDFYLKGYELYVRTFSIEEIRRMASLYNSASL